MTIEETSEVGGAAGSRVSTRTQSRAPRRAPSRRSYRTGLWVVVTRVAVAALVTVAVSTLLWWNRPQELHQPDDIVGYPSFHDFNFHPQFLAYRIAVWVVPFVMAAVYWLLSRWGPWRSPPRTVGPREPAPEPEIDEGADDTVSPTRSPGRYTRILPAAVVLAMAFSANTDIVFQSLSAPAVGVGVAYVGLVLLAAWLWGSRTGRPDPIADVNSLATPVAAIAGLYWFARHTAVIDAAGVAREWPWLPWWIAVLAVGIVTAMTVSRLRTRPAAAVERGVVTVLGGGVLVFMATARLPGAVTRIQGFDDMHSVTGADLLSRGYFPWRDVLFMHGVFEDALRSNVGFAMFERSVWGATAAGTVLWLPLLCIGYYLLTLWAAPRQWALHLAVVAAMPWAASLLPLSIRWVAVAFIFILLGESLRRASIVATVVMTTALFITAVLVPEHSFQVIAVLVALVVHDLSHRPPGTAWWSALRLTRIFAITGAILTAVWCAFLAGIGGLREWVDYYIYFGPGHAASGALPLDLMAVGGWRPVFVVSTLTVVLALGWTFVRLLRGMEFTAGFGVLLAAALTAGGYGEKGLARFDVGHIGQVVTVAIPLWIVMVALAGSELRAALRNGTLPAPPRLRRPLVQVPGLVALALTAVVTPSMVGYPNLALMAEAIPSHNRSLVPQQDGNPEQIGYSAVGDEGTDLTMVSDLSTLLDSLAPDGSTVYDFTNSPGYFNYLLREELPTRFYTIGLALPEVSQEHLLDELKAAEPSVVVFDDLYYGLPSWDGPRNEVRHYLVSAYLLDGWTPVVSAHGFLFMLRNDLVDAMEPLPTLQAPVQTDDLYFSMPDCDWGHIPDYLHATPSGEVTTLQVGTYEEVRRITASGWAYDPGNDEPVQQVLAAAGTTVLATSETRLPRPDVADFLDSPGAAESGFALSALTPDKAPLAIYAVHSDGRARVLGDPPPRIPTRLELPDGQTVPVVRGGRGTGGLDDLTSKMRQAAPVDVPDGTDLRSFDLATFVSSSGPVGSTKVTLFDGVAPRGLSQDISFEAQPSSGSEVSLRVGACLQWHGYDGDNLYISQRGGSPVTEIRLSDVAAD